MNAKSPQQRTLPRLLMSPEKSKGGVVTIAPAGMYDFGNEAPKVYCVEPLADGLFHE
jgi:hypothetical protein